MTEDELEELLRRWGGRYGEPHPDAVETQEVALGGMVGSGAHPLARAMTWATKRPARQVALAYVRPLHRDAATGAVVERDPTPCRETRVFAGALFFAGAEVGRGVDPQLVRVERAALELARLNPPRGLVLRAQYCRRGAQESKVEWVGACGHPMKLRLYRDHLAHARSWMHGRLA